MIRQVDSSLLEEWERLNDPNYQPPGEEAPEVRPPGWEEAARDITRDATAFTALIRTRVFAFLRALAGGDADAALVSVPPASIGDEPWDRRTTARWPLDGYLAGHRPHPLGPDRAQRQKYIRHSR